MSVRTRFAPSPTGYMHIGGMRTALFNWLWARHNNGTFILRIDDTDAKRNMDEALGPILQAFRWLGLDWDEGPDVGGEFGPYFQSQRGELYKAALQKLLDSGAAYYDFDKPEDVRIDREAADKEKRPYLTARRSLEFSDEQVQEKLAAGEAHVVRLKVPRDQKVSIVDHVRGEVEWDCGLITDPVLARGDGSPLYNFACVVDDAQLQISHVIRAEEHLSNTPTQVLLYQALGYDTPEFAHIPFVTAPGTSKKMSKRNLDKYRKNPKFKRMFDQGDRVFEQLGLGDSETLNPVMVEYYEKIGYLPAGLLNALARLGWSLDDKTEFMSLDEVVKNFTLDRVVKAPAGLDPDKLLSYQEHWFGQLSLDEKVAGCIPFLEAAKLVQENPSEDQRAYIGRLIIALDDRLKLFSDIIEHDDFFTADEELKYDEKAFTKRLRKPEDAAKILQSFRAELAATDQFDAAALDKLLHDFVDSNELQIGQIIHALRVAVTGRAKGPGMFDILALLGKDRCLNRIDRALGML